MSKELEPRPPGQSREQIELDLLVELSTAEWHDVTEVSPDPDAVQCFAYGINGKRNGETIFYLTRYEDDGAQYALVSQAENRGPDGKATTTEQFKLEWLWESIHGKT